jgi:DNA polymerase I-like protein with 3'-5' exonuclease and polymerase domains
LYNKRKLKAPTGWERYFYGRPDDNTLREAVAWSPQHTIPFIMNKIMLFLMDLRKHDELQFHLIAQVHDAIYLLARDEEVDKISNTIVKTKAGHPLIQLVGGELYIPRDVKVGKCLANLKGWKG